jgi:hypothetical protein
MDGPLIDLDQSRPEAGRGADGLTPSRWRHGRPVGVLLVGALLGGLGGWQLNDYQRERAASVTDGSVVAVAGRITSADAGQVNASVTVVNTGVRQVSVRVVGPQTPGLAVSDVGRQTRLPPRGVGSVPVLVTFDCGSIHQLIAPVPVRLSVTTDAGRTTEISQAVTLSGDGGWRGGAALLCGEGSGRTTIVLPAG